MQRAFAYIRVSGQGQRYGDGPVRQRSSIRAYAKANGYTIVKWFEDLGVSGTVEALDRPGWNELMKALHSNGTRVVIVERLDRLARTMRVQETAIGELQTAGFELISVHEPDLMSEDPDRVMIRQILGSVAQRDKSAIVIKLRAARMRKKAADGRCEGRKPYGFYEGESAVIERMKALRAEGLGFDRIAAQMNTEGLQTRTRGKWHGVMVNRILKAQESGE